MSDVQAIRRLALVLSSVLERTVFILTPDRAALSEVDWTPLGITVFNETWWAY